jgi:hypothetical protein
MLNAQSRMLNADGAPNAHYALQRTGDWALSIVHWALTFGH